MRTLQEMTLQEKLGQRLAAGFQGLEPPEEFLRLIKEYKVGNIILFRRNIQDGPQLKRLCATLRKVVEEETGVTPFITIDQEGGVVTRLPESEVNIPGAMAVAATGNPRNAYDMGLLTAQELRSCGVDFNLAPACAATAIRRSVWPNTAARWCAACWTAASTARSSISPAMAIRRWIPTLACPASTAALTS